jgi:hypothetical protein
MGVMLERFGDAGGRTAGRPRGAAALMHVSLIESMGQKKKVKESEPRF